MLIRIANARGTVSIDENIISDMIAEGVRAFPGKVWVANYKGAQSDWAITLGNIGGLAEKEIRMTEAGVFVRVYLVLRFGESISKVTDYIIEIIRHGIEDQLELELADIELKVTGTLAAKNRIIKRNITVSLRHGQTEGEDGE